MIKDKTPNQALATEDNKQIEEFKELLKDIAELPPENRKDVAIFITAIIATLNSMPKIA